MRGYKSHNMQDGITGSSCADCSKAIIPKLKNKNKI